MDITGCDRNARGPPFAHHFDTIGAIVMVAISNWELSVTRPYSWCTGQLTLWGALGFLCKSGHSMTLQAFQYYNHPSWVTYQQHTLWIIAHHRRRHWLASVPCSHDDDWSRGPTSRKVARGQRKAIVNDQMANKSTTICPPTKIFLVFQSSTEKC